LFTHSVSARYGVCGVQSAWALAEAVLVKTTNIDNKSKNMTVPAMSGSPGEQVCNNNFTH